MLIGAFTVSFFKADEVLRDDSFNPDEDDLLEDDDNNDLAGSGVHEMEDAPDATQPPAPGNNNNIDKSPAAAAHDVVPQKQAALIEDALDMACERLLKSVSKSWLSQMMGLKGRGSFR